MKAPLNPKIKALFTDPRVRREYDKQVRNTPAEAGGRERVIQIKKSSGEVVSLRSTSAMTPSR
jgi:hypothetical protein